MELDEIQFSGIEIITGKVIYGDLLHSPITSEFKKLTPEHVKNGNTYYIVRGGMMKQIFPDSVRDSIRHKNLFKRLG